MKRLQRLRTPHMRDLCAQTEFTCGQLIQPLFVVEGLEGEEPIRGLGETKRQGLPALLGQIERDLASGISQFLLFVVPAQKAPRALDFQFGAAAVAAIKRQFGASLNLWVDICLCSATDHGHCCLFNGKGERDHISTLAALSDFAVRVASAGADGVAPSDMMDGRVAAIRQALDELALERVPVLSYSTKFASFFYGPFRQAANSAPQFGDRREYQIDVRNRRDALQASIRCAAEGADLLMVKPGMSSIDLLQPIEAATGLPVGAYQVSGEYASMALAAEAGLMQFEGALLESWHVMKRAGAQFIITYGARQARELGIPLPRRLA